MFLLGYRRAISILVGGLEHVFPYTGNVIIPTDELIFFQRVGKPPTSIWLCLKMVTPMIWPSTRESDDVVYQWRDTYYFQTSPLPEGIYNVGPPNVISWFITPSNYSYLPTINPSEIVVICTNLAIQRGPHIATTTLMSLGKPYF